VTNERTMSMWSVVGLAAALLAVLCSAGCGGSEAPVAKMPPEAANNLARFRTAAEPAGAVDVAAARAQSKQGGSKVVVVGRIANIVQGFAVFTLMDRSLPYCGEKNKDDTCSTPWDYCCEPKETRTAHSMVVELRDAAGKPIATPSLPDLRLLDLVVVSGALQQDEHGNPVLVAAQVFRRERPTLPDNVRWPQ